MSAAAPLSLQQSHELNADTGVRCHLHGADLPWAASPSASVWRRRLALEGPLEAGRVTSIVRYDAGSSFHEHGHPDGEEILVLSGAWQGVCVCVGGGGVLMAPARRRMA